MPTATRGGVASVAGFASPEARPRGRGPRSLVESLQEYGQRVLRLVHGAQRLEGLVAVRDYHDHHLHSRKIEEVDVSVRVGALRVCELTTVRSLDRYCRVQYRHRR